MISVETKDQGKHADPIKEALSVFWEVTLQTSGRAEEPAGDLSSDAEVLELEVGRFGLYQGSSLGV